MGKLYIEKHILLVNNSVYINSEEEYSADSSLDFSGFAKSVYKNYDFNYSKFYKMDSLSKLGFLAAEFLFKGYDRVSVSPEEIAIICANSSSSLSTDKKYQDIIADTPSPAIFVYTLPNIVSGEICIRNNIKGESLFFIQEEFDTDFISSYVKYLFENTNTKLCIAGWIEMNMNKDYRADLFLISGNKEYPEFNDLGGQW